MQDKPLRQPFYLGRGDGGERRARKLQLLVDDMGCTSQSEVLRRLVDAAAKARGISVPGDQLDLLDLGLLRRPERP